ncbi:hypothetical protein [uncultured Helicobacter sp.]
MATTQSTKPSAESQANLESKENLDSRFKYKNLAPQNPRKTRQTHTHRI